MAQCWFTAEDSSSGRIGDLPHMVLIVSTELQFEPSPHPPSLSLMFPLSSSIAGAPELEFEA